MRPWPKKPGPLPVGDRPASRRLSPLTRAAAGALDVRPTNVVNDTSDPSLDFGRKLLRNGSSLPLAAHALATARQSRRSKACPQKFWQCLGTIVHLVAKCGEVVERS